MRLLAKAIPRFIQLGGPLPPLKPMGQSQRGVIRMLEAQMRPTHPLIKAILRFLNKSRYNLCQWVHLYVYTLYPTNYLSCPTM
jgi:hypothetical protein